MTQRNSSSNGAQAPADGSRHDAIQVVAKCDTFRRAGFVFTRIPTTLLLAALSQQQLAQITAEPMLAVQPVTLDAEG